MLQAQQSVLLQNTNQAVLAIRQAEISFYTSFFTYLVLMDHYNSAPPFRVCSLPGPSHDQRSKFGKYVLHF